MLVHLKIARTINQKHHSYNRLDRGVFINCNKEYILQYRKHLRDLWLFGNFLVFSSYYTCLCHMFPNTVFICKSVLRMSQLSLWHTKTKTVRNHYLTTAKKKFKIWWQPAFLRGCSWPSCCRPPPPRPSS